MFKLKTVGAVTLASLLLLSGCSSNNLEDEVELVNNNLPYDSRTVTTTIPAYCRLGRRLLPIHSVPGRGIDEHVWQGG